MTGGYGILTEIFAVAGRDIEDCCSPKFYYKAYKVKLGTNPLRLFQKRYCTRNKFGRERSFF